MPPPRLGFWLPCSTRLIVGANREYGWGPSAGGRYSVFPQGLLSSCFHAAGPRELLRPPGSCTRN